MSAMKIPGMLLSSVVRVAIICVGIERAIHQTISDGRCTDKRSGHRMVSLAQAIKKAAARAAFQC
jgi:hypothetical protein